MVHLTKKLLNCDFDTWFFTKCYLSMIINKRLVAITKTLRSRNGKILYVNGTSRWEALVFILQYTSEANLPECKASLTFIEPEPLIQWGSCHIRHLPQLRSTIQWNAVQILVAMLKSMELLPTLVHMPISLSYKAFLNLLHIVLNGLCSACSSSIEYANTADVTTASQCRRITKTALTVVSALVYCCWND